MREKSRIVQRDNVFWDKIMTIIDISVALQSKKRSLICATKSLEELKSSLGVLRRNIFHGSLSGSLSIANGLSSDKNVVADKSIR
jgi:hypothetical protein